MRRTFVALATVFVALACALATHRLLQGPQVYPQLVVGALAWSAESKAGDLAAALVFMLALPVAWWVLDAAASTHRIETSGRLVALQLACAPGIVWLAQAMFFTWTGASWLYVSAGLIAWWTVGAWPNAWPPRGPAAGMNPSSPETSLAFILVPLLSGFSALGLLFVANRALLISAHLPAFLIGFVVGGSAVLLVLRRARRDPSSEGSAWRRALLFSQIGIPLLALGVIPTPLLHDAGLERVAPVSMPLVALAALVALAVALDIARSARREAHCAIASLASPLALFLCLWILRVPFTDVPTITADDWHFGELILPWAAWHDFGLVPYADVMPVRGFVSLVDAALTQLFMGGNAADIAHLRPAIALLYSAIAFCAMRYAAGTLAAIVAFAVLDFASPITRIDYLFVAGVAIQAGLALRRRFAASSLFWLVSAATFVALAPGQALLYAVATAPLLAFVTWHASFKGRAALATTAAVLVAALTLLSMASPTLREIESGIRFYFADNVAINATGSGIPWADSFESPYGNPVVREAFRSFFLVVAAAVGWVAFAHVRGTGSASSTTVSLRDRLRRADRLDVAIAACIVLTAIVFLPRVLGRIDVDSASRLGALTLLVCALTPLMASTRREATTAGATALVLIFVAAGIQVIQGTPNEGTTAFTANALGVPRQSNVAEGLVDERTSGLHRVGTARFDPSHLEELQQLRRLLDEMLPRGTPYYDFSNRNAHYVYFDRPVATRWSSPYYLADERAQLRTASELASKRVPLLLLGANNIAHDGGSAALRAYWLYRFVLSNYVPFNREGYVFAVRRDLAKQPPFAGYLDRQVDEAVLFEDVFAVADLRRIPLAWGASAATLDSSFRTERADARPVELGAGRTGLGLTGDARIDLARFDMLRLSLQCHASGRTMHLAWSARRGGTTARYALAFEAGSGVLLVPIGSRPGWTLADDIADVSLDAEASGCAVGAAQWLQRTTPVTERF